MQTLLKHLKLNAAATKETEIHDLLDAEYKTALARGDLLGAGEWMTSMLDYDCGIGAEEAATHILSLWSSPDTLPDFPATLKELSNKIALFEPSNVAKALIALRARKTKHLHPDKTLSDLAFKLRAAIADVFSITDARSQDVAAEAEAKLNRVTSECLNALKSFSVSNCSSARTAAVEVLKKYRALRPLVLPKESALIAQAESLLGGGFREFSQSYEKGDMERVVRQIPDVRRHANEMLSLGASPNSVLWHLLIEPISEHLLALVEEANRTSRGAITPALALTSRLFKTDLGSKSECVSITVRLENSGVGAALNVDLVSDDDMLTLEGNGHFDLQPKADSLITLTFRPQGKSESRIVRLEWHCTDILGSPFTFEQEITISQQKRQPDWNELLETPPYSINPIRKRADLFGREAQLNRLLLSAASSTSTFLWGQKRVGKTSLLQVLQEELTRRPKYRSIYIRMGEIMGMHEGQFSHLIASRLAQGLPYGCHVAVPPEPDFGAGAGRLVPFVEGLSSVLPDWHFLVIIDEFDDLAPSFYMGERGRLFMKALRSLSEIGLTFFFAGSERMSSIYERHAQELNKWQDLYLDSIESSQDCHALVVNPVQQHIEYEENCVNGIISYCCKNPFFLHLYCSELFQNCLAEQRTYVGEADAQVSRSDLISRLGHTNFAHLWEDNPTLERDENRQFAAENCLVLTCISSRGSSSTADEISEVLDTLDVPLVERLSLKAIGTVLERLRSRKVVMATQDNRRFTIAAPIFRQWLSANAHIRLLPVWNAFVIERSRSLDSLEIASAPNIVAESTFVISEDDLLAVSSKLVYLGKQKEVAEIRSWLRQFDDDTRIELAFALLRRLTEKGYTSSGAREYYLGRMVEVVTAHRQTVGNKVWSAHRGRIDNLCISYVDSETKSGATTAREMHKRLQAIKSGDAEAVSPWLRTRSNSDPILVLVDDFSGTGETVAKGFVKWKEACKERSILEHMLDERRVIFVLGQTFPESTERLRDSDPRLQVSSINVLGPEVRAFDPEAGIFESDGEREFAQEVMLQVGRELTNSAPLGYGNQAALLAFHDTIPNNTLPIFWSNGHVNEKPWKPLFPRA